MQNFFNFFWDSIYRNRIIVKFIISGGTATFTMLSLLFLLTDVFGLFYVISGIIAFILATSVGFSLHKFWTFKDKNIAAARNQMAGYFSFQAILLAVNTLGLYLLVDLFGWWHMLAQFLLSGTIAILSFFIYKIKIFTHSDYLKSKTEEIVTRNTKPKLCYVLQQYDKDEDTHFAYLYSLLEKSGEALDIFLIVEKSSGPVGIKNIKETYLKEKSGKITRFLEGLWLSAKARSEGYSDFYVHYSFIGAISSILVTKIRGGRVFYWNCGMPWLYKRGWFEEKMFRFILRNSILVTGTEGIKNNYVKFYNLREEDTRVLPNWIDIAKSFEGRLEKFETRKVLDLPKDKKLILSIQRLSERKGVDLLVPTARELMKLRKDFLFIILGKGPDKENLIEEIKRNNLEDHFSVVGTIPQSKVLDYFAATDAFFMPSREEGFPHALLETLAFGVPFVISDVGGVSEVVPKDGPFFLSAKKTPEDFALSLGEVLKEKNRSKSLMEHTKKYDIDEVVPQFIELFSRKPVS